MALYRERPDRPETEPFAVIKARSLTVNKSNGEFKGNITDFFAMMGDADYVSSTDGKEDTYILCWFDDSEDDSRKSSKKLGGVRFSELSFTTSEGKRTYNASFQARYGKLS